MAGTRAGPAAGRPPAAQRRKAILACLERGGPAAARVLAEASGLRHPDVYPHLAWLAEAGLAAREARAWRAAWEITTEGRARLCGAAPRLALACADAVASEARPLADQEIADWAGQAGWPATRAAVQDALEWLSQEPHALLAQPPGSRRWRQTGLGSAVAAMDELDWAPLEMCVQVHRERESGDPGMSGGVAAGILAWAGIDAGAGDDGGWPAGLRTCWTFGSEAGGREIGWTWDAARRQWALGFRVLLGGAWETIREVLVTDLSMLAYQVREIAGSRPPGAEVVWKPGDPAGQDGMGGFWALAEHAGPCDPALAAFREAFRGIPQPAGPEDDDVTGARPAVTASPAL
jgi:hypothetical protein